MFRMIVLLIYLCIMPLTTWSDEPDTDSLQYWPQWRGPLATGEAPSDGTKKPTSAGRFPCPDWDMPLLLCGETVSSF